MPPDHQQHTPTLIPHARRKLPGLLVLLVLLLFAAGAWFLWPADPTPLQRADQLFVAGRYHDALQTYRALADHPATDTPPTEQAETLLRLGMVYTVRGEHLQAETFLRGALDAGLSNDSHDLALLYLGTTLYHDDRAAEAARVLAHLRSPGSPAGGVAAVVRAEGELRQRNYTTAADFYRAALSGSLPLDWFPLASYRLALLRAAGDESEANATRETLETVAAHYARGDTRAMARVLHIDPANIAAPDPLLTPLLPDMGGNAGRLLSLLSADTETRPQLLGQFYLEQGYYELAEAQFARVNPNSSNALVAAAHAAYSRWRSGERLSGTRQLEALVAAHPDNPRLRTMLALIYLWQNDLDSARTQIATVTEAHPLSPDIYLAWAHWYTIQSDYASASKGYQQATRLAAAALPERQGDYLLLRARFHLSTTYAMCREGLSVAEQSTAALPTSADAWAALAATRYSCTDFAGAVAAARTAHQQGAGAEATYYLGAALLELGDYAAARRTLIATVDLAPASVWRERAEEKLLRLPEDVR